MVLYFNYDRYMNHTGLKKMLETKLHIHKTRSYKTGENKKSNLG